MYRQLLLIYLISVTLIGICAMGADKRKAVKGRSRIPEKTLFIIAAIGGAFGVWLGMEIFRHKTRRLKFQIGIPGILTLHIIALSYIVWRMAL